MITIHIKWLHHCKWMRKIAKKMDFEAGRGAPLPRIRQMWTAIVICQAWEWHTHAYLFTDRLQLNNSLLSLASFWPANRQLQQNGFRLQIESEPTRQDKLKSKLLTGRPCGLEVNLALGHVSRHQGTVIDFPDWLNPSFYLEKKEKKKKTD